MVVAHHIIADQKRYVAPTGRRALKASGAAVLRDGVYLEPERESCRASFNGLAAEVSEGGGTAHVLRVKESEGDHFVGLFDRSHDFAALLSQMYAKCESIQNDDQLLETATKAFDGLLISFNRATE